MNQGGIPRKTENFLGELRGSHFFAALIVNVGLHYFNLVSELLISNNVPLFPGTAPEIQSSFLFLSILMIFKFFTVILSPPVLPAIRVPLKTL